MKTSSKANASSSRWPNRMQTRRAIDALYIELLELDGERADEYQWAIAASYEKQRIGKKPSPPTARSTVSRKAISAWPPATASSRRMPKPSSSTTRSRSSTRPRPGRPCRSASPTRTGDKEKAIRTFQLTCKRYPKAGQAAAPTRTFRTIQHQRHPRRRERKSNGLWTAVKHASPL